MSAPHAPRAWLERGVAMLLAAAVAAPLLWPWQPPPIAQFMSHWVCVTAWALLAALWFGAGRRVAQPRPESLALAGWWLLVALVQAASALTHATPPSLLVLPLLVVGTAAVLTVALTGFELFPVKTALRCLCLGVLVAGVGNAVVVFVDWVAPGVIVRTAFAANGRAVGLLAQPNHLAVLALWAGIAAAYLLRDRPLERALALGAFALVLLATQSRTGLAIACWLAAAALHAAGGRRPVVRGIALALLLSPVVAVGAALVGWLPAPDSLEHRLMLWRNAIALIAAAPLWGHGFGLFNWAWTLAPLPDRAPDLFDHAHNLVLHWAVEFGLPVTLTLLVAIAMIAWRAWVRWSGSHEQQAERWTLAAFLFVVLAHSLVEHPFWFSYFLLPSVALLALAVAGPSARSESRSGACGAPVTAAPSRLRRALAALGVAGVLAVSLAVLLDYRRLARLNAGDAGNSSVAARLSEAKALQGSCFFGHLGDYAAIMLAGEHAPLAWFERPMRYLIDEALLAAYARALARAGDQARLRWVMERAAEFPPHPAWRGLPRAASLPRPSLGPLMHGGEK
ncbi:MAG: Wzy polymerase domain-containing protein [Casimicrobiaceae bacterium]|nr:Wzy polymerase domain-containing protein [Casimicrobiaceae bacterium]